MNDLYQILFWNFSHTDVLCCIFKHVYKALNMINTLPVSLYRSTKHQNKLFKSSSNSFETPLIRTISYLPPKLRITGSLLYSSIYKNKKLYQAT